MDIKAVRRQQLRKLVDKYGSQTALAEALDVQQNYISRTLKNKPIGEKFARKAERILSLPRLYFDTPDIDPDGVSSSSLQNQLNELPAEYRLKIEKKLGELLDAVRGDQKQEPDMDDTGRWRLTRKKDSSPKRKKRQ